VAAPTQTGPAAAYDPLRAGCRCFECPLRRYNKVVPPEHRPDTVLVVGLEPGVSEEREGRPFVGPSGEELMRAVAHSGRHRYDFSFTNARLCRLPDYEGRPQDHRASLAACKPRLRAEIAAARSLLLLGSVAFEQSIETSDAGEAGLTRSRGFPLEPVVGRRLTSDLREARAAASAEAERGRDGVAVEWVYGADSEPIGAHIPVRRRAVATWHPAAVLRKRRLTPDFRLDVDKAVRHTEGWLDWPPYTAVFNPTADFLDGLFDAWERERRIVAVDLLVVLILRSGGGIGDDRHQPAVDVAGGDRPGHRAALPRTGADYVLAGEAAGRIHGRHAAVAAAGCGAVGVADPRGDARCMADRRRAHRAGRHLSGPARDAVNVFLARVVGVCILSSGPSATASAGATTQLA